MKKRSAALILAGAAGLALIAAQAAPSALAAGASVCTTQNASACASSLSASAAQSQGHASKRQAQRHKASNSHSRGHAGTTHHSGRATARETASSGATSHGTTAKATGHGTASSGTARHGTTSGDATPLNLPAYSPGPSNASSSTQLDTSGLLLLGGKFAIVLVLLLICLRVLRAVMPRLQGNKGQKGALVLHDEAVGDKGRVMLLDLETRLIVVGATGTTINGLTTIDDPAEVAHLRQRYRPEGRKAPLITIDKGTGARGAEIMPNRLQGRQQADTALLLGPGNHEPAGPAQVDEDAEMPSFATLLARNTLSALHLGPPPELPAPRTRGVPVLPTPAPEIAPQETREAADDDTLDHALDALRSLRRRVEVQ